MTEIVSVLIVLVASPFVVYTSVKLGTYAFYRGRQLFERENKDGKSEGRTASVERTPKGRDA
jgi:hypothetical protein